MVHWPGAPPVRIDRVTDLAPGDPATITTLSIRD